MAIVPREEVEKEGGVIKHPVGTGPYKFVEWKQAQYVLLERFDQYKPQPGPENGFGGERIAYADKIKLVIIPEDSGRVMALLNKEIDVDRDFPPTYVEKYEQDYAKRGLTMDKQSGLFVHELPFRLQQPRHQQREVSPGMRVRHRPGRREPGGRIRPRVLSFIRRALEPRLDALS